MKLLKSLLLLAVGVVKDSTSETVDKDKKDEPISFNRASKNSDSVVSGRNLFLDRLGMNLAASFNASSDESRIERYDSSRTTEQRPQALDSRLEHLISLHGDMRELSVETSPKNQIINSKKKNRKKDKNSKRQRKANQKRQRRMKLRKTLSIMRTGKGKGKGKGIKARSGVGFEEMGVETIEEIQSTQIVKTYKVNIKTKTYQDERKLFKEVGQGGPYFARGAVSDNPYGCATMLESVGKEYGGLRCPPGQVWAANKNPRCALSFSDAVYEKERPDCAQKPSPKTADFACICPCKRKYLLTFNIDYDITENENLISSRNTECQLCRSEKQILIHGLNLSATDTKKCERTIRRDTKAWLASGEF